MAGSLSKTAAVDNARGRTQLAGLTAALLALLVILVIAPVLSDLPRAVLSAIVVNAVWKLMDWGALRRYARVRRIDVMAAVVAAVGVLVFGPLNGLLLAVAASVVGLVYRSSRVEVEVMGKVPHEKAAWGSLRNHDERPTYPGVLVLRVDTPMFWVTAVPIQDAVLARVEAVPGTRVLVLDLEATNQMDVTSADALSRLLRHVAQARHRPLPRPGDVAGPTGAEGVGAAGAGRPGPHVAQHLAGGPAGTPRARSGRAACRTGRARGPAGGGARRGPGGRRGRGAHRRPHPRAGSGSTVVAPEADLSAPARRIS